MRIESSDAETSTKTNISITVVLAIIASFLILLAGCGSKDDNAATMDAASEDSSTSISSPDAPATGGVVAAAESGPKAAAGTIGVTRAQIEEKLGSAFAFTEGAPKDGVGNYIATSTDGANSVVQVLATPDQVKGASIMAFHDGKNAAAKKQASVNMKRFVSTFPPSVDAWVGETLSTSDYNADWKHETTVQGLKVGLTYTKLGADEAFLVEVNPE